MGGSERLEYQVALVFEVFGFGFGCLDWLSSSRWFRRFGGFVVVLSGNGSSFVFIIIFLDSLSLGSFPHYWLIDWFSREKKPSNGERAWLFWIELEGSGFESERGREGGRDSVCFCFLKAWNWRGEIGFFLFRKVEISVSREAQRFEFFGFVFSILFFFNEALRVVYGQRRQ